MCAVCVCGHMFQEDLALFSLTHDDGYDAILPSLNNRGGLGEGSGPGGLQLDFGGGAALELRRRRAATGPEMQRAQTLVYHYHQAKEAKRWLKMVVRRLLGDASAVNNPYERRIWAVFESLKIEAQKRFMSRPESAQIAERRDTRETITNGPVNPHGLKWGSVTNAALAACTYACFKEEDEHAGSHNPLRRRCFSLHLIASCCDVTHKEALRWAKRLRRLLPARFGRLVLDTPERHVDHVVKWLQEQVKAAKADQCPLLDARQHLAVLRNPRIDWVEVRRLSRLLCAFVFDDRGESSSNSSADRSPRDKMIACEQQTVPGEWAFLVVLWALGTVLGKKLVGKVWVKRELIWASLGFESRVAIKMKRAGAKEDEDDSDTDEEDEDVGRTFDDDDTRPNWPFIALYQDIGIFLAANALQLPWVDSKSIKRAKGGRDVLKDGEEIKYLRDVVEFSTSLRGKANAGEPTEQEAQERPSALPPLSTAMNLTDLTPASTSATPSAPASLPTPLVTPTFQSKPSCPPSYTARNFPQLSAEPELLDCLESATVDVLLFQPGEMDGYLRIDEAERRRYEAHKRELGDWDEDETERLREQERKRRREDSVDRSEDEDERQRQGRRARSQTKEEEEENDELRDGDGDGDDDDVDVVSLTSEHYR